VVVDFQGGIRRMSKGDNIRGTSATKWLKKDKIVDIRRFDGTHLPTYLMVPMVR